MIRVNSSSGDDYPPFRDRQHAGRLLAANMHAGDYENPVVLALPRGGVPLAAEIANTLCAPLDLIFVRKIGVPGQQELAVGALVDGNPPELVVNEEIQESYGISEEILQAGVKRAKEEIDSRRCLYSSGIPPVNLKGKTAIVADDGIATGATVRAALLATRKSRPTRLILAVGVASVAVLDELAPMVDEIVCLHSVNVLHSVGQFYTDFSPVSDQEVKGSLNKFSLPD